MDMASTRKEARLIGFDLREEGKSVGFGIATLSQIQLGSTEAFIHHCHFSLPYFKHLLHALRSGKLVTMN
jgi:hypothetical protein